MLSIINEKVLATARRLNERDVKLANGELNENNCPSDESFWAKPNSGADGLRGKDDQRVTAGGSHYSYGPYPRNRRILADIALCTGWNVKKFRELEQFCVSYAAAQYEAVERAPNISWDLSDLKNPLKDGKPFTFQHIAWCRLNHMIKRQVEYMDPGKLAVVKAGVLDMYESNSKTGKKKLPPKTVAGKKRKIMSVQPDDEKISQAQEEIDKDARYSAAVLCSLRPGHREPALVKSQIKAYMNSYNLTERELCEKVGMKEEEWNDFLLMKKKHDLYGSKAYHAAKKFLGVPDLDEVLEKENAPPTIYAREAESVRKRIKR
ncbi:hypothetical protein HII31_11624 [Pseudocercospora fuligena]|uniref:Uncharacterized protein n=1 Tax=Pseudocercospora fuligena TaxID=685502 RepID=A0A8H6VD92_9PEZI|nr:hypothetical protein HII31_11624 [Pseudocercospora fuligena]